MQEKDDFITLFREKKDVTNDTINEIEDFWEIIISILKQKEIYKNI